MTTASNDIITLLDKQKQLLDELLLSLRQEIAALASRDITTLENITTQKTTQLQQLQQQWPALQLARSGVLFSSSQGQASRLINGLLDGRSTVVRNYTGEAGRPMEVRVLPGVVSI